MHPYTAPWSAEHQQLLVSELQQAGLDVQATWSRYDQPSEPAQANKFKLLVNGHQVIDQNYKDGVFTPDRLTPQQSTLVLGTLYRLGLISPPDYTVGILCGVLYAALYVLAVAPSLADISPLLLVASIITLCMSLLALSQLMGIGRSSTAPPSGKAMAWLGFPGVLLHAPGILLLLPLLKRSGHARLLRDARGASAQLQGATKSL